MNRRNHHYPYIVDCEGNELPLQPPSSINSEEEEEENSNPFQTDHLTDIPYVLTSNIDIPFPSDIDYSPFIMDDPLELDNLMFSIEGKDSTQTEPYFKRKKNHQNSISNTNTNTNTTTNILKHTLNSPIFNRKYSKNP